MRLGVLELVVIFLILLLLVGAKQLPKLADSMGQSLKSFKNGYKKAAKMSLDELDEQVDSEVKAEAEVKKEEAANVNETKSEG